MYSTLNVLYISYRQFAIHDSLRITIRYERITIRYERITIH